MARATGRPVPSSHGRARTTTIPPAGAGVDPPAVREPVLEVDLIPAERTQLGDAQPMAVSDQDHGGIAVAVPVLPCGGDQTLDFLGVRLLAGAAQGTRNGPGRNCPILRGWRSGMSRGAAHRTRALARTQLSHFGSKMGQLPDPTTKKAVETALSQFRRTNEKTGCRPLQQLGPSDEGSEALLLVRNRTDAHASVRRRLFREARLWNGQAYATRASCFDHHPS